MGMYMVGYKEILDNGFEDFLRSLEGDVSASELAKAWNFLAKKYGWQDTLKAIERGSMMRR